VDGVGGDTVHGSGSVLGTDRVLAAALLVVGDLGAVPLGGGDGVDAEHVHGVDLLERTVLGLDDEEEDEAGEEQAGATEDETVPVVDVVDDEGGEEGDEEVPQPVGRGGQGHAGGTVAGGVQLGDDGPDERTPGGGEGDDEQAGEDDQDVTSGGAASLLENKLTDEGVDQEADDGPESTDDKSSTASALLDDPKTTESAEDVDGAENDLSDVGVVKTDTLEDGCAVVEEEVGTSELLAGLEHDTDHDATKHGRGSEHLPPLGVLAGPLLVKLEADLVDLVVDGLVVGIDTTEASDGGAGLLLTTLTESETGRLGKEEHATAEDEGEQETETDGDSPGSAGVHGVGAVVDHVSGPDTEGDEELVASNDDTADDSGSALRLVHGDSDTESTNTHTGDETANGELSPVGSRGDFDDHANGTEEGGGGDRHSASKSVGELSNSEGADEGTGAEHRDDGTLAGDIEPVGNTVVANLGGVVGEFTKTTLVVGHLEVTGNLTRSVAEHETTDGGDKTKEDGDEGDLLVRARELIVARMSGVGQRRRGLLELGGLVGLPLRTLEEGHGCLGWRVFSAKREVSWAKGGEVRGMEQEEERDCRFIRKSGQSSSQIAG